MGGGQDGSGRAKRRVVRDGALSVFRGAARVRRVRGMHRLALRLYDPYQRSEDYVAGVYDYDGGLIQLDTRSFIEWWIYMYGSFEGSAVTLLSRLVGSKSVVADVGANIGSFTLPLARRCQHVHAFEPHPQTRARLRENLALNGLRNVTVSGVALSDRTGSASLFAPTHANQGQASLHSRNDLDNRIDCAMSTLDLYVAEQGLDRLDLIKVDVEGAELDVLLGSEKTLSAHRPAIYVEVNPAHLRRAGTTADELAAFLGGLGYELWANCEVERSRRNDRSRLVKVSSASTTRPIDYYWLAVHPDSSLSMDRIESSSD